MPKRRPHAAVGLPATRPPTDRASAPPHKLLTRAETAGYLGVSLRSFQRHVRPHVTVVRVGSMPRFTVEELERWIEAEQARR